MKPLVSVLMPAFNAERHVAEAVRSILRQSLKDFEFLILDDGSRDRTGAVIRSLDDARVRLIRNEINLGLAPTLDHGLRLARGQYIARMDSDDIAVPQRLETQLAFLESHASVGVVGSAMLEIDEAGRDIRVVRYPERSSLIKWALHFGSPIAHPTVMMRREIALRAGGYLGSLLAGREAFSAEDYDLWRRAAPVTEFHNLEQPLVKYRKHGGQLTAVHTAEVLRNGLLVCQALLSETVGKPVGEDDATELFLQSPLESGRTTQACSLLSAVYDTFLKRHRLARVERQQIDRDYAKRIWVLRKHDLRDPRVLQTAMRMLKADGWFVVRRFLAARAACSTGDARG